MIKIFYNNLKEYWPCILILLAIVGFVSKSLYNYPMGLMAIIGLYRVLSSAKVIWNDTVQKTFIIMFLCLWLPLLVSFSDAANQAHAAQTVFPYLRFLFAGLFIIQELSKDEKRLTFIVYAVFMIVTFWCIDAVIQFFIGHDLFGYPWITDMYGYSITGMFYPKSTISHICSILSAFCFFVLYKNIYKYKWLWLILIPIFFVVLVGGRRAAWLMLALSSVGFCVYVYLYSSDKKYILKLIGVITLATGFLYGSAIVLHKPTSDRFEQTLGLFSNDYDSINLATSARLPIWETAYAAFKASPINGIGPRGFRHAYQDYVPKDKYYQHPQGSTHPHLFILEIMTETGVIGLLAYLILLFFLVKDVLRRKKLKNSLPFLLPVLVALFPFNTHMAFYGSISSTMIWWLIAVHFSNIHLSEQQNTN